MAYAEVSDLNERLEQPLTGSKAKRAQTLLEDASALLSAYVPDPDAEPDMRRRLRIVCCNMVMRAMATSADMFGVMQSTVTADIYSQTFQYSNPNGDFFLTKADKKMLGLSNGYIGSIQPRIEYRHSPLPRCCHD